MSTGTKSIIYGFLAGNKKDPVLFFHSFTGFASQSSVDPHIGIAGQTDFPFPDFFSEYGIR